MMVMMNSIPVSSHLLPLPLPTNHHHHSAPTISFPISPVRPSTHKFLVLSAASSSSNNYSNSYNYNGSSSSTTDSASFCADSSYISNSTSSAQQQRQQQQIEMLMNPSTGVYTPRKQKVVVLWDLDNKPPRGPPYPAALALRRVAELFGQVDTISAYANRHAFTHLPHWVLQQRQQQRHLDRLERKGLLHSSTSQPNYVCGVCGRKCKTNLDLKKHFKQLHERERQKKLARMHSIKSKRKRQNYKERFISNNHKYEEAARQLLTPKTGYGLAAELKRAGVFVKTVEDKPQAADWALKRQMQHSVARGIDWLFLVSDDSDFTEMVRKAREAELRTVVVGDTRTALGRQADLWVPWARVENGEVGEEVLRLGRRNEAGFNVGDAQEEQFLNASFYESGNVEEEDDDDAGLIINGVTEDVLGHCDESYKVSAFSEEEVVHGWDRRGDQEEEGDQDESISRPGLLLEDLLSDSEDEDECYI